MAAYLIKIGKRPFIIWGFSDFFATENVSAHHSMSYTPCGFLVRPS